MKKRNSSIITIIIVIALVVGILLIKNSPTNTTTEEIAKCIGEESTIYTQLGCHACENQKQMFGESYQYLNIVDCWYEEDKCGEIDETPTWRIKNKDYKVHFAAFKRVFR